MPSRRVATAVRPMLTGLESFPAHVFSLRRRHFRSSMSMFKPSVRHIPVSSAKVEPDTRQTRRGEAGTSRSRYPHRLNFYDRPPTLDITLDEFETCAIDRLRVLTHIESLSHRSLPAAQITEAITTHVKEHLPLNSNTARGANLEAERRRDEIGHWVLRLSFCRSPDLRARFIRSEAALFRHRFMNDAGDERAAFLQEQKFDWHLVGDTEKTQFAAELKACMPPNTVRDFAYESWFKVPWYTVPDLVQYRKVFVRGGMAYVPQSQQISLVIQAFSSRLEKALELTAKNLPRLDEDERLGPVIDHLASSFLAGLSASTYQSSAEQGGDGTVVTAEMVDDVARRHFPPCMRNLYERFKRDHHLKHFGRLQLLLFLKGIGLPLDEALIFWRKMFGPTISDDKFNKEYKYNVRHSYGQEGKRANYPPKSCEQILTQNQPGTQDAHGCPFRHFSPENLTNFLLASYPKLDRSSPEMRDILDSVKNSHYHVACTRVFEVTHDLKRGEGLGKDGESVTHPNKYFDRSRELEKEKLNAMKPKDEDVVMG